MRTIEIGRDGGVASDLVTPDQSSTFDGAQPLTDTLGPPPSIGWARSFGRARGDYASGVAVDRRDDTLFVTGSFEGAVDFGGGAISSAGQDLFVASYSSAGDFRWAKGFGAAAGIHGDSGHAITVDSGGDIFVTGHVGEGGVDFGGGLLEGGYQDVFVARFGGDGAHRWSRRWADIYLAGGNYGTSIDVDTAGNVVVGGSYSGAIDFGDGELEFIGDFNPFVLALDGGGDVRWSRGATRQSGDFSGGGRGTVAPDGTVYLAGEFGGFLSFGSDTLLGTDGFHGYLISFDRDGGYRWLQGLGAETLVWPRRLLADANGNVLMVGSVNGPLTLGATVVASSTTGDTFVASWSPAGALRWARALSSGEHVNGGGFALGPQGNIYLGGYFQGTVDFGDGPHTATGVADLFVLSLTPDGHLRWSLTFGGDGQILNGETISALAVGSDGTVYAVGSFRDPIDLGFTTLRSAGEADGFIMALQPPRS